MGQLFFILFFGQRLRPALFGQGGEVYLQTCFVVGWGVLGLGREMRYVGRGFAAWGKTFFPAARAGIGAVVTRPIADS